MQERIVANSVLGPADTLVRGEPCWIWMGKTRASNRGNLYPAITRRISKGPRKGKVVNETTTRVVVREFLNKRLSRRQVVMHLCNVSLCVNPTHLIGGSQKKNVQQTIADGRHRNGVTGKLGHPFSFRCQLTGCAECQRKFDDEHIDTLPEAALA